MALSHEEKEELLALFVEAHRKTNTANVARSRYLAYMEETTHQHHHEFLKYEIERRRRRKELCDTFKSSFLGGIALVIISGLGWLGAQMISLWKQMTGN